ncbi:hypothetical protein AVEN_68751-1 [Araneus ventricosus]|uniref:Uncharacterized protein n=1 Tax=Araneus ventricosus TaxID=182803 RepID=A0A4Y2C4Y7_ARAVE|nr:hypothetical protein AVEN_68751-1 [Araneus ventricosus]
MADYFAKTIITTVGVSIHHVPLPRCRVKSKLILWTMKERQEQWVYNGVGHGSFPVYLKRTTKHPEENCSCGKLRNPLHYATECYLTKSFHFTKTTEVNRVAWMRAAARNKLSRNKIVQLVRFLAVNEALIKLRHLGHFISSSRYLPKKYREITETVISRQAYFEVQENMLLAMLTDVVCHIITLVVQRIIKAREIGKEGN